MGILVHPQGLGVSPSEADNMTIDQMKFWFYRLKSIKKALDKQNG